MDHRADLVAQALRLFAGRGYEAVGVQEIVDAAGVTKPTLYHYFGSKRGLLDAVLREASAPLLARLEPAARYAGDLPQTLTAVIGVHLRFAAEQPAACRLLLSLSFAPPESAAVGVAEGVSLRQRRLVEAMFQDAAADHGNMRGRHRRYALSLIGLLNGYAALVLAGSQRVDDRLIRDTVQQFSHGIYS
jgi:TetR/AcrR family transcriptional regulator